MKKMIVSLVVVLLFGLSNIALAQNTEDTKDISVTVGLKMWYATWESVSVESDHEIMYGPAVNIRHKNFFAGVSYLTGNFTFTEEGYDSYYGDYEVKLDADRTDIDLSIGYYVHPRVALFLGYKKSEFEFTVTEDTEYSKYTADFDGELNGPALGVTGNYPIGDSRAILFGTLSYSWLDFEIEGEEDDVTGPAIEFGIAYAIESMPVSVSIGYKYQNYEPDDSSSDDDDDDHTFSGLTFGVNYTF